MTINTVAILSPGEMGAAVGRALGRQGLNVISCLQDRSYATQNRAKAAGIRDGGTLKKILKEAQIIFSILPPGNALQQAKRVADSMQETGRTPDYVDCNAVAPETAIQMAEIIDAAGANYIDGGIVGNPPGGEKPTRVFVSGSQARILENFKGEGITFRQCGAEIGKASAIKMCYAGITKGTSALHTAMMISAELLGVSEELTEELVYSQTGLYNRMEAVVPALPAVSDRYIGEMEEISKTLEAIKMPTGFHDGSAKLYEFLTHSPYSEERRETVDQNRSMQETIKGCAKAL